MAGSPALRGGIPSPCPTTVCQLKNQWSRSVRASLRLPKPMLINPPWGVTDPGIGSSGFPIQGPQGGNDQWGRGQRPEPFHSACGWRPVGCRLARGTQAQASLTTYCTSQTFPWLVFWGWHLARDAALPVAGPQGNQSLASLAQGGRAGLVFKYPMPGGRSMWNCCGCTRKGTSLFII